jgi:hypothetical protein
MNTASISKHPYADRFVAPDAATLRTTPSDRVLQLEAMNNVELERVFLQGSTPDLAALAGWEFRGLNVPGWAKLAGIKKFVKGFFDAGGGVVMGYNCPVAQNKIADTWNLQPSAFAPKRFGFYQVAPVDPQSKENKYLHAVLLNYGEGGNSKFDPSAGLRDYLVQVDHANRDVFLGKAFYAVGPARIATNFFILERMQVGVTADPRR